MDTNYLENNYLTLVGRVSSEKKLSHEIYGERFYSFDLTIPRLSGSADVIPVTASERLFTDEMLQDGTKLLIKGQFRSYNSYENEKNKLILTVFAKDIEKLKQDTESEEVVENIETTENAVETAETSETVQSETPRKDVFRKDYITNEVVLIGYICKSPVYRQTPFGREIADLLLAVNRAYNKSDYIPSIAWGRNARFCQNLEVGTEVKVVGRVQSRNYEKKLEDGTVLKKVAYEVSIGSLEVIKEAEHKNEAEDGEETEDANSIQEAM